MTAVIAFFFFSADNVAVWAQKVRVEYLASRLPADATPEHPDGEVVFSYEVR